MALLAFWQAALCLTLMLYCEFVFGRIKMLACRRATCCKVWFRARARWRRCTFNVCSSSASCGAAAHCSSSTTEPRWKSSWCTTSPSSTIPNSTRTKPYSNTSWMKRVNRAAAFLPSSGLYLRPYMMRAASSKIVNHSCIVERKFRCINSKGFLDGDLWGMGMHLNSWLVRNVSRTVDKKKENTRRIWGLLISCTASLRRLAREHFWPDALSDTTNDSQGYHWLIGAPVTHRDTNDS